MKKHRSMFIGGVLGVTAFIALLAFILSRPGKLDAFAQCLADTGAVFYGASWCPVCAEQKNMFGRSQTKLPYVECSVNGSRGEQTQTCRDAEIASYPTWDIRGERIVGLMQLQTLAERSGCALPE